MSFVYFVKLLLKNLKWLVIIPASLAVSIFYFTRHEKKVYSSETAIYTGIASGYNLNGNTKVDNFTASNAYDNLISMINSRETKKEVALRLLAEHLCLAKHDPAKLSWDSYQQLKKLIPDSQRAHFVRGSVQATYDGLKEYMERNENNLVYKILNTEHPYYSILSLNAIKPARVNSSDLIKISYETNDAAICKRTLELILEVFMRKQKLLKEGQSESVVAFFEQQTREAFQRLDSAELDYLSFNKSNNIINYQEQTKAVAGEKELLYAQNHNMEMDRNAANVSLEKVNENLEGRRFQSLYGSEILGQRQGLADLYNKIAVVESIGGNTTEGNVRRQLDSLKSIAGVKERQLQETVNRLYEKSNTPNGIPTKEMLDEWMQTMLSYEQSKARLAIMDKRKREFDEEYKRYAPLGAMLKKIERKINVSEQAYLEMLHELNVARLQQQNNELTSKLHIVDAPYLPLSPNPSKRMMLVVVGFMAGFILVLAVILARALINQTLQHPSKASRAIGLPMLGIYPLRYESAAFIVKARLRLLQHLVPHLDTRRSVYIGFVSVHKGEGKTTLIDMFYEELLRLNYQVAKHEWKGVIPSGEGSSAITLIEFSPLDEMVIKPGNIPLLHTTILVCRANRVWGKIDKELLQMFMKTTGNSLSFVLNGVSADFAEEVIGEIPKKRSLVRSGAKRLAKFEFGSRERLITKRKLTEDMED